MCCWLKLNPPLEAVSGFRGKDFDKLRVVNILHFCLRAEGKTFIVNYKTEEASIARNLISIRIDRLRSSRVLVTGLSYY